MRTTLKIDDDVLVEAIGIAARERKSLGAVISTLVRFALRAPTQSGLVRNGVPLFPRPKGRKRLVPVTTELVQQLREGLR